MGEASQHPSDTLYPLDTSNKPKARNELIHIENT